MTRKITLHTVRLAYSGIFDLDDLYKTLRNWFTAGRDYELIEEHYKHKVPSPAGSEDEMRWRAWRKVTGFVKFTIRLNWHFYDMKEVEVIKEGKKRKLMKARLWIEFVGDLELDYSKRWGGSKFMIAVEDWFLRYIWKRHWDNIYGDELFYTVYKVYTVAKEKLDMDAKYFRSKGRY